MFCIEDLIKYALKEDINNMDITSELLIPKDQISTAKIFAKEEGVLAGLNIGLKVFETTCNSLEVKIYKKDSQLLKPLDEIVEIKAKTIDILKAERVALNFMQRLSGIATITNKFVKEVEEFNTKIVDTRKTTPLLRNIEKEAVRMGLGFNHRFNLSDGVLIKENHILASGGIKNAIKLAKKGAMHMCKIEIEVKNLEELNEALEFKADIIMLDNMDDDMIKESVKINNKRALLEASGNMALDRVKKVASLGVDLISVGALTHSAKSLDLSLLIKD